MQQRRFACNRIVCNKRQHRKKGNGFPRFQNNAEVKKLMIHVRLKADPNPKKSQRNKLWVKGTYKKARFNGK